MGVLSVIEITSRPHGQALDGRLEGAGGNRQDGRPEMTPGVQTGLGQDGMGRLA